MNCCKSNGASRALCPRLVNESSCPSGPLTRLFVFSTNCPPDEYGRFRHVISCGSRNIHFVFCPTCSKPFASLGVFFCVFQSRCGDIYDGSGRRRKTLRVSIHQHQGRRGWVEGNFSGVLHSESSFLPQAHASWYLEHLTGLPAVCLPEMLPLRLGCEPDVVSIRPLAYRLRFRPTLWSGDSSAWSSRL